eukprot:m.200037 g.200037  ORF g.200037 m.200037 type:complete len:1711 (+) comp14953_c0_seq1:817-5949(+)
MSHANLSGPLLAALLVALCGLQTIALPQGFGKQRVGFPGKLTPLDLDFLPDNKHMLVVDKAGEVFIIDYTKSPLELEPFMTIPDVDAGDERGALGMVVDPEFQLHPYFYVYYSPLQPKQYRVSRFTVESYTYINEETGEETLKLRGNLKSELPIWVDIDGYPGKYHYGGGLAFGPDNLLYLTTGDKSSAAMAQDQWSNAGGVFRFNRNGKAPADNYGRKLDGAGGVTDSMWAYGLRNGYRATWDTVNGREPRLLIAEVGGNNQQDSTEDIHIGGNAKNFGWPNCEGYCTNIDFVRTCSCALHDNPLWSYAHDGQNACIVGGQVYSGSALPPQYYGAYFFADHARRDVYYLTFHLDGSVNEQHLFEENVGRVTALKFGPDDNLYVLNRDSEMIRFVSGNSSLHAISHISASVTQGPPPLEVTFTIEYNNEAQCTWSFGDGKSAAGSEVTYIYTKPGHYVVYAELETGIQSQAISIYVGGVPEVKILSPTPGLTFVAGDTILLQGSAEVDGHSADPSSCSWRLRFLHDDHWHPVLENLVGLDTSYLVGKTGHSFEGDTGFDIALTCVGPLGAETTQSVNVFPQKIDVTFISAPPGEVITVDGIPRTTPFVLDTVENFHHEIQIDDFQVCNNGIWKYQLDHWNSNVPSALPRKRSSTSWKLVIPAYESTVVEANFGRIKCNTNPHPTDAGNIAMWFSANYGVKTTDPVTRRVTSWADAMFYDSAAVPLQDSPILEPTIALQPKSLPTLTTFRADYGSTNYVTFSNGGLYINTTRLAVNAGSRSILALVRVRTSAKFSLLDTTPDSSACKSKFDFQIKDGKMPQVDIGCDTHISPTQANYNLMNKWTVVGFHFSNSDFSFSIGQTSIFSGSRRLRTDETTVASIGVPFTEDPLPQGEGVDIAELLMFDERLSVQDLERINAYLAPTREVLQAPASLVDIVLFPMHRDAVPTQEGAVYLAWTLDGDGTGICTLEVYIDDSLVKTLPPSTAEVSLGIDLFGANAYAAQGHEITIAGLPCDPSYVIVNPATRVVYLAQSPIAVDDTTEVKAGKTTIIEVLENDKAFTTELDASSLVIVEDPQFGHVSILEDGAIQYTWSVPTCPMAERDVFTYMLKDVLDQITNVARVVVECVQSSPSNFSPFTGFTRGHLLPVTDDIVFRLNPSSLLVVDDIVMVWLDLVGGHELSSYGEQRPVVVSVGEQLKDVAQIPAQQANMYTNEIGPFVHFQGGPSGFMSGDTSDALPSKGEPRTLVLHARFYPGKQSGGFGYGMNACNSGVTIGIKKKSDNFLLSAQCRQLEFKSTSHAESDWHVLVGTIDLEGAFRLYVDGELIVDESNYFYTLGGMIMLGGGLDSSAVKMDVTEALIYRRALSVDEMGQLSSYFAQAYDTATMTTSQASPTNTTTSTTTTTATTTAVKRRRRRRRRRRKSNTTTTTTTSSTTTTTTSSAASTSSWVTTTYLPMLDIDPARVNQSDRCLLHLKATDASLVSTRLGVSVWYDNSVQGLQFAMPDDACELPSMGSDSVRFDKQTCLVGFAPTVSTPLAPKEISSYTVVARIKYATGGQVWSPATLLDASGASSAVNMAASAQKCRVNHFGARYKRKAKTMHTMVPCANNTASLSYDSEWMTQVLEVDANGVSRMWVDGQSVATTSHFGATWVTSSTFVLGTHPTLMSNMQGDEVYEPGTFWLHELLVFNGRLSAATKEALVNFIVASHGAL